MEVGRDILNILSSAVNEYLGRRTDDLRKSIVTGLSVGFSRALAVLIITMLLFIVLGVFAYAFIVLISEATGSLSGAAFIVGGVYLVGAAILFMLRKRLFLNMFANIFAGMIPKESAADSKVNLLLMIVRNLRRTLDKERKIVETYKGKEVKASCTGVSNKK